jgi:hypothetical protein
MTGYGSTLRAATDPASRDAATRDALLAGFGITATARALGVPRGTVPNRAHRLGLVYDKSEGKWIG